jgi:RimJ/RimL family protein N-acetyltransferase
VLGAGRLQLKTDERNARSRAGILGVGATFEGILRQYQRRGEGPGIRDTAMYSILAAEWPVARAHLARRIAA